MCRRAKDGSPTPGIRHKMNSAQVGFMLKQVWHCLCCLVVCACALEFAAPLSLHYGIGGMGVGESFLPFVVL